MKSKVDKYDVDKLVPVPTDLSKLSDVGNNEVIKKNVYNELVKNINAIKTTDITNELKKLTMTQKLRKLRRNSIIKMINVLLLKNSIIWWQIILLQDQNKQIGKEK